MKEGMVLAWVDWSDNRCIICGNNNPHGLQLQFPHQEAGVRLTVTVGEQWQGFEGIVHGGIVAGILDDAMWHATYTHTGRSVVTARLEVRYRRPWPVGLPVVVEAQVERQKGRLAICWATAHNADDGGLVASARGHFLPADSV